MRELSEKTGFSTRMIDYWITGERGITLMSADKIFRALGIQLTIGISNKEDA